ncbi:MAG: ROK family protein, partial [Pseudomonadota bacterium]
MLRLVEPSREVPVHKLIGDAARARIIGYLMAHRSARRSEMARSLSLSRTRVAEVVSQLQTDGLVTTARGVPGGGSVRNRTFALNRFGAGTVGLELGHRKIIGVLTSVDGSVLARQSVTVDRMTPAVVTAASIDLIGDLLHEAQFDVGCLVGIGMAVPSAPQDLLHGPLKLADVDCWAHLDAERYFEAQLELPVTVARPVELAAIAEPVRAGRAHSVLHFGAEIDMATVLPSGATLPLAGLVASRRGVSTAGRLTTGEGDRPLGLVAGLPSMNAALGAANRSGDV